MIFDGYAAGLPLISYDIPYVKERAAQDRGVLLLPSGQPEASAEILVQLATRSGPLSELARAAHRAGQKNAADRWYRRRAEWTLEAFARDRDAALGKA